MKGDLTRGPVMKTMLCFSIWMILGNLLQQCYNIVDTLIVGRYLGANALAAVGSSFTLMTFLTSIILGLCMGSGSLFSFRFGQRDETGLRQCMFTSFFLIFIVSVIINIIAILCIDQIIALLQVPQELQAIMKEYLIIIFFGIFAMFLYNYVASFLRAIGNSLIPLLFLAMSTILNILLDLYFIIILNQGVAGAALATILSQYVAGIGISLCAWIKYPQYHLKRDDCHFQTSQWKEVANFSFMTCAQQSVMNLGILMVQGLVNSFGTTIMAAFAAAVKIDSFAYMPLQDFGNAFSTFIAQNHGAKKEQRMKEGIRGAFLIVLVFCFVISLLVVLFARPLMMLFIDGNEHQIIAEGVHYLRIEGTFYLGIGFLFLYYGYYRAMGKPGMSVVLTIVSLGTRVILAYWLSSLPLFGVSGIWWSVPIGWFLADLIGFVYDEKSLQRIDS